MRIFRSIRSRLEGLQNDLKSRYWEYTNYYLDDIIWSNTIFFEAFGGKNFQGNVFYIYQELFIREEYKNYKFFISHQQPKQLISYLKKRNLIDNRIEVIQTNSFRYRECLSHSKYLINNVSFCMDFIKKKDQIYLNTWHGTPLKFLGRRIKNDAFECNNAQRNFLMANYIIAPNDLTKKVINEDYMIQGINSDQIMEIGYPRNSVFFDIRLRNEIRKKHGLEDKNAILYMPTWRGSASQLDNFNPVKEIERLAQRLGNSYIVYVKFHPAMMQDIAMFKYCRTVPDDLEIYEFLNAMDSLITDYSSVFFDYACTGRNIYLIQQDREKYFKNRGIYEDVEENIPFPVALSFDELYENIIKESLMRYTDFQHEYCKYDSLYTTRKLVKTIFQNEQKEIIDFNKSMDLYVIDFPVTDEKLKEIISNIYDTEYRLVFVPKRSNNYFKNITIFDQINYLLCRPNNRLKINEKIFVGFLKLSRLFFRNSNIENIIQKYARREQHRLWGNLNVRNIYAKDRWLPIALSSSIKIWKV